MFLLLHDTQIYYSGVPLLRNGSYIDLVLKKGICCSKWRLLNVLGGFQDKLKEMGGCCCCSSKGTDLNTASAYYYYPRASEEHVPLSSGHGGASALSTGLLVDTNLDTSIPDTYRPPPAPMPYDVILGRPQTPPMAEEICNCKMDAAVQTTNSESFQQTVDGNTLENSAKSEDPKESECKVQIDFELDSAKGSEVELSKPVEPVIFASEEEDCAICLEEYDAENPKISTKCEHHFHLACILEWMERSDACPVCDKEMIFNPPIV
ncbi:probable E3 ubiquitin-protein ligase RHB1A isoform X3 [Juglans microcarpa x Juglans regia]|nr:probable E3 ubiquitin-protein ligase RHB1A isoform X3 [Juglans microcarpa x Juglans regia]XP_040988339.1 probable E3 ubiquitin-protein ligase RHB1A isoform X3 [Juglans microcarpa x Juglans regia]